MANESLGSTDINPNPVLYAFECSFQPFILSCFDVILKLRRNFQGQVVVVETLGVIVTPFLHG